MLPECRTIGSQSSVFLGGCPRHGPTEVHEGDRQTWQRVIWTAVKIGEDWYNVAQDRNKWSATWSQHLEEHQQEQRASGPIGEKTVLCRECGWWFRREADKTRHKCAAERRRPVCEQGGALQCEGCQRWFWSRGARGLAVHRCRREELEEDNSGTSKASQGQPSGMQRVL